MLNNIRIIYTRKSAAVFGVVQTNANWTETLFTIGSGAVIVAIISSIFHPFYFILDLFAYIILAFLGAGILWIIAVFAFKGTGKFLPYLYTLSLIWEPILIINSFLNQIPLLGIILSFYDIIFAGYTSIIATNIIHKIYVSSQQNPTPKPYTARTNEYTQNPTPKPYTAHTNEYTQNPTPKPYTAHTNEYTQNPTPKPYTANTNKYTQNPTPKPYTANTNKYTQNPTPKPYTAHTIADMHKMTPSEFENYVGAIFKKYGYIVKITGKTGDNGIDIELILKINDKQVRHVVQCKRFKGCVGENIVREFFGSFSGIADRGYLVTTGTFSKSAKIWVKTRPITLIDGSELVRWANDIMR